MMTNYDHGINWTNTVMSVQYVMDTAMMRNDLVDVIGKVVMIDLNMVLSYGDIVERVFTQMATEDIMK